ncbi:shikimate dehydrogenase, partial [Patescibacteria group bacterium]|nr:shikimate dehydrogenase [Patescibacteria group bacterium]
IEVIKSSSHQVVKSSSRQVIKSSSHQVVKSSSRQVIKSSSQKGRRIMLRINAKTKICMIIGDPVEHSLSPAMHNRAYEVLGIDDEFVFIGARVKIEDVKDVVRAVKVMGIRGLTCTIPHKVEIMKYLDKKYIDPVALKIGAVNTIVNDNGVLKGFNTDWQGVLAPLEKEIDLEGKSVAILGAGGVARAMAYAVSSRGAFSTVFNRTLEKAEDLSRDFGGQARSYKDIACVQDMDIILNATPLGMAPRENETPLPKKYISKKQIVFDAIYAPYETRLLLEAKQQGAKVMHGAEMLLYQGIAQFELYTGRKAPESIMREVLEKNVIASEAKQSSG